jgi:hypothetical protein
MSDPNVRVLGQVEDIDGLTVNVGVDYETVVIGGHRFNQQQQEEFARLFVAAAWQAGQQSRTLAEDEPTREAEREHAAQAAWAAKVIP